MFGDSLQRTAVAVVSAWVLVFARLTLAAEVCDSPDCNGPISIPMTDVALRTLQNGETLRQFGAMLQIGRNEPQNFSLEINLVEEHTYVYSSEGDNPGACENTTVDNCFRVRGGLFERDEENGWEQFNEGDDFEAGIRGANTFRLNGLQLDNAPMRIFNNYLQGGVGLGQDSSLIKRLKDDGLIASRSWSVWFGQRPQANGEGAVDGHLVFGGKDEAKMDGEGATWPIGQTDVCETGFVIRVQSVSGTDRNGDEFPILDNEGQSGTQFCIVPGVALMSLPEAAERRLTDAIPGRPLRQSDSDDVHGTMGRIYSADESYNGELRFTIVPKSRSGSDTGLSINFPNSQLSIPARGVRRNGQRFVNNDERELLVGAGAEGVMPRLGHSFLRSVILSVDREANTFTLTPARPSDEERLEPILAEGDECKFGAGDSSNSDSGGGGGTSPAAIGGIFIGVLAGISLISIGCFYYFRQRKRQSKAAAAVSEESGERGAPPSHPMSYSTEAPGAMPHAYFRSDSAMGSAQGYYGEPKNEPIYELYDRKGSIGVAEELTGDQPPTSELHDEDIKAQRIGMAFGSPGLPGRDVKRRFTDGAGIKSQKAAKNAKKRLKDAQQKEDSSSETESQKDVEQDVRPHSII